jgi:S-adenosylmethionine:tRNA ribosyltransferase-isomerase
VYAQHQGSVAAPTAGLHFTDNIFKKLEGKKIKKDFITLHVGAGTFKPVKAEKMELHEMHAEWIDVHIETLENIISSLDGTIIAVGTTSLRTLESLYWLGAKACINPSISTLKLTQWEVYETALTEKKISCKDALGGLLEWLKLNNLKRLFTQTQIIIAPGYQFKIAKGMVTNFHQPQSTLLLLVAAAIGNDWRKVYDYALQNDYRFLSYGDGSLIFMA